jgi:outer membrane protein assembly factor BamD (BamD/ComL family)
MTKEWVTLIKLGNYHLSQHNYKEAYKSFTRVSKLYPTIPEINQVNETRIRILERCNEIEKAEKLSNKFSSSDDIGIQKARL